MRPPHLSHLLTLSPLVDTGTLVGAVGGAAGRRSVCHLRLTLHLTFYRRSEAALESRERRRRRDTTDQPTASEQLAGREKWDRASPLGRFYTLLY